ncbi:hypothetical protein MKX78_05225 [Cytobacillus sp. FSL R5-0569]|uniref:hypothetical protein n=1 Tax=unclassified Cytobacillus TaxID=2675268 RepID=UPI0030FB6CDD
MENKYQTIKIKNEFATVEVYIENSANGPRLCITDVLRERTVYLDPLQVECLTRLDLTYLENYLPY